VSFGLSVFHGKEVHDLCHRQATENKCVILMGRCPISAFADFQQMPRIAFGELPCPIGVLFCLAKAKVGPSFC
jgi:hypothetical protein